MKAKVRREERAAQARDGGSIRAVHCAVENLIGTGHVERGGLDAIFCDPPYEIASMDAWHGLAAFAAQALRPGGLLIALSGQVALPQVYSALDVAGLKYRWTCNLSTPGAATQVWTPRINTNWKPILLYETVTDFVTDSAWFCDTVTTPVSKGRADSFHAWGQSEHVADLLAERFLTPGMQVCDPFGGGGEFPIAAARIGCHVITADRAADAYNVLCALDTRGGMAAAA